MQCYIIALHRTNTFTCIVSCCCAVGVRPLVKKGRKVATLSTGIEEMEALSLNCRLSKFVMEVAKKTGERYPAKIIYGIVVESCSRLRPSLSSRQMEAIVYMAVYSVV